MSDLWCVTVRFTDDHTDTWFVKSAGLIGGGALHLADRNPGRTMHQITAEPVPDTGQQP